MTSILLGATFCLLVPVFGLLAYIMTTERIWKFHKIWDLALCGHHLSRWYLCLVAAAFLTAVAAWVSAFIDHRSSKAVAASFSGQLGRLNFESSALRSNTLLVTDAQLKNAALRRLLHAGQRQRHPSALVREHLAWALA